MKFRITYILLAIMLIAFVFELITDREILFNEYGFSGQNLISKPYVLLSAIFLHGDLGHLLSNILVLLFFGIAIEDEIGKLRFLGLFFLGAIAGDLLSLAVYSFDTIGIGASAGIFALIGFAILAKPFDWSISPVAMPIPLGILGIVYAIYTAIGFVAGTGSISYAAHFGGLLIGLIIGMRREGLKKSLSTVAILLAIIALIPLVWILISRLFA